MKFELCDIKNSLKPFIESIFYYDDLITDHSIERVVPTGHIFLLFELDNIPRLTYENYTLKPQQTFTNVWLSGSHKNFLSISSPKNSSMFVVQFKPLGAHPFIWQPLSTYKNRIVNAIEVFGSEVIALRSSIMVERQIESKFNIAQIWLENRFKSNLAAGVELEIVLSSMYNTQSNSLQGLLSSYSKSQKHLIDNFKKYNGLTPKVLHRIIRFNEILKQIKNKEKIVWTEVSYKCGYSDQSHFIKEFKLFSGFNPSTYLDKNYNNGEANFFPLN